MKFSDLKPDDPWFQLEETRAFVMWIREQKTQAFESALSRIRAGATNDAITYVGQGDAWTKTLTMIQEGK